MCTIRLQDIMQGHDYPDSGALLFDKMMELENVCDKVVLDLDGVISLPSIFLNVSVGKYIMQFGVDALKEKYSFAHISVSQIERLKKYIGTISEASVSPKQ